MIAIIRNQSWCNLHPVIKIAIGWALFLFFYFTLKNYPALNYYSAYLSLTGEAGLDALAALLAFKLKAQFKKKAHQRFFLILSISFIAALFSDFTYNIFLNLFNFNYENTLIALIFEIPFALFLLLQLIAMIYILSFNRSEIEKKVIYLPNIILSLLISTIFMFGIPWKISYFSPIGLLQFIDTILEAAGFSVATICLSRSKNQPISFIIIGYLLIVSSDFIIRHHVVSGTIPYLSPFEATWVLGLLITCLGFYLSLIEEKAKLASLIPVNSLQAQLTIWFLILWLGSLIIFIAWSYLFVDPNYYNQISKVFLSALIPISVLVIIGGNFLSNRISSTLFKLESVINHFIEKNNKNISDLKKQIEDINKGYVADEKFGIYEVDKLCNFIIDTITELQLANRVKADFLMKMSHDFRTPASGIHSMSQAIYKRIDDPQLKRLQKLIVQSSEQLINLLEDLLDYSRLDSNQYEVSVKTIDIQSIVKEVILLLSAKAEEKKLTITYHYPNLAVNYNADPSIIHRVILNVLSNAIKFTHFGEIIVHLKIEKIKQKKWILIKIKDPGIGIDEKYHQLIFEPFFRVESPETAKSSGIGLGLSNALLMLKKIGGKLILKSNINQGSTFSLLLPLYVNPKNHTDENQS